MIEKTFTEKLNNCLSESFGEGFSFVRVKCAHDVTLFADQRQYIC